MWQLPIFRPRRKWLSICLNMACHRLYFRTVCFRKIPVWLWVHKSHLLIGEIFPVECIILETFCAPLHEISNSTAAPQISWPKTHLFLCKKNHNGQAVSRGLYDTTPPKLNTIKHLLPWLSIRHLLKAIKDVISSIEFSLDNQSFRKLISPRSFIRWKYFEEVSRVSMF